MNTEPAAGSGRGQRRWRWIASILVVLLANVLIFNWRTGYCVDYAPGHGESYCTNEPIIGAPGAWTIAVVSVVAIAYCLYRLASFRRPEL